MGRDFLVLIGRRRLHQATNSRGRCQRMRLNWEQWRPWASRCRWASVGGCGSMRFGSGGVRHWRDEYAAAESVKSVFKARREAPLKLRSILLIDSLFSQERKDVTLFFPFGKQWLDHNILRQSPVARRHYRNGSILSMNFSRAIA